MTAENNLWQGLFFFSYEVLKTPFSWIEILNSEATEKSYLRIKILLTQWHPTPALLPGKSHGRRSLEGCSPWGRWGSDMAEWLHFHFSLSCTGEGNGNPLQCSCQENPGTGKPGGLPSMGLHRVGHYWSDLAPTQGNILTDSPVFTTADTQRPFATIIYFLGKRGKLYTVKHLCVSPSTVKAVGWK